MQLGRGKFSRACALVSLLLLACIAAPSRAEDAPAPKPGEIQRTGFDHLTTGFELTGQHRDLPCENCHVNAMFKGTPRDCSACHGVGVTVRATAKPPAHILSSNNCGACHTPNAWSPAVNFNHTEVFGSCSSCHNGTIAQGKGPNHIQTDLECDVCHSTLGWAGATFSHVGVTTGCASCHNGAAASGLPPTHIPVGTAPCEACHVPTQYTSWAGATMNHPAVTPPMACAACHEAGMSFIGVKIVTRPPAPHPTTGDCGSCHTSFVSFKTGTLQPANHIPTTQPCTLCHSNPSDYSVYVMSHSGITGGCATCHAAGLSFANMAPPILREPPSNHVPVGGAACEACHAPANFSTFAMANASGNAPPAMVHAAVPGVACATCHAAGVAPGFIGTPTTRSPPATHIPFGGAACESCHAPGGFASFVIPNSSTSAPPGMVHAAVTGAACLTCHATGVGSGFYAAVKELPAIGSPGGHVATSGADCGSCHAPAVFSSFSMVNKTATAPPGMVHALVASSACSSCHEAALSFLGSPSTVVRPQYMVPGNSGSGLHPTTGECSDCHASTTSFLGASIYPTGHIPNPGGSGGNCANCHTTGDYTLYAMNHAGITTNCAQCHAQGLKFAGVWTAQPLKAPPSNHVPFGSATCEGCHSATAFTTFAMPNVSAGAAPGMVHSMVAGVACATCHAASAAAKFVGSPVTKSPPSNHIPFGSAACESCHAATAFDTFAIPNSSTAAAPGMVHTAVAGATCLTCHGAGVGSKFVQPVKELPAIGSPGGHVATNGADCGRCHSPTVYTSFSMPNKTATAPPGMVHAAIGSNACSSCHEASLSWLGAPATVVRPQYFVPGNNTSGLHPTSGECSDCHLNTTSFLGASIYPGKHIPNPGGSTANCATCHTTGDYTAYVMSHAGITSKCAQCHAAGLAFDGVWTTQPLKAPPANHVPFGTAACESCHAPANFTTFQFTNAATSAPPGMVHAAVPGVACAACHSASAAPKFIGTPVTKSPPSNHIPFGSAACEGCHSSTVFTSFLVPNSSSAAAPGMVHSLVSGMTCLTCHATGVGSKFVQPVKELPAIGSPGGHVATNGADCGRCHSPSVFSSFVMGNVTATAPPGMVHAVVGSNACSTCHEAGLAWLGAPPTVLRPAYLVPGNAASGAHPATGECSNCHLNTVSFLGAVSYPPNHIPNPGGSTATCGSCHTNASDYTQYTMSHAGITSKCAQCHASGLSFAGVWTTKPLKAPPANHIPFGTAACETCHAPANFTTFQFTNASKSAPPGMVHAAVPGVACATCHAASVAATFIGTPAAKAPPSNHVPFGTAACETCHVAANVTTFKFTNATGTAPPAMVHAAVPGAACSSCHEAGLAWAGSPATVLRPQYMVPGNAASGAHPPTGECSNCHLNTVSFLGAVAYPSNHIPNPGGSGSNCTLCHQGSDYSLYVMNHAGITNKCAQCHAAGLSFAGVWTAQPLKLTPATHVPIGTAPCESCHAAANFTTFQFANAATSAPPGMVHAAVAGVACATCHSASAAPKFIGSPVTRSPPSNHIPFGTAACEGCHSSSVFTSFVVPNSSTAAAPGMVHARVSGMTCLSCHATGVGSKFVQPVKELPAIGSPGGHVATNGADCGRCHSPSVFSSFVMGNVTAAAPPGMVHTVVGSNACSTCHEAAMSWLGTPVTVVRPQYLVPGNSSSGLHPTTGECSGCHLNTVSFLGAVLYPSGHIPNPGGSTANCANCHTTGDYSQYVMSHAGITSGCAQCHAKGLSFTGVWTTQPLKLTPATHIPFGTAACESCHSSTAFATFTIPNSSSAAPPGMVHAAVAGAACLTCHATGVGSKFVQPVKELPAIGSPGGHVATNGADCDSCHSPTGYASFSMTNKTATSPPGMVHSVVAANACSTCHQMGQTWLGAPATVVRPQYLVPGNSTSGLHPTTGECSGCHLNTVSFLGAVSYPSGHIPNPGGSTANCATCHTTGDYSKYVMSHAGITTKCAQCHAAGLSFAGVWTTQPLKLMPATHVPVGSAACESCHAPANFTTFQFTNASANAPPGMVHSAVAGVACATCHAASAAPKFIGTPVTKSPPANHIPFGSAACEGCHSPSTYTSFAISNTSTTAPPGMVHAVVAGVACLTCHNTGVGSTFYKPVKELPAVSSAGGHVATNGADCGGCHAPTVYTSFSMTNKTATAPPGMVHTLVSANACSTCHQMGMTWLGAPATVVRPQYLVPGNSASGLHPTTGECSGCHLNTVSFLGAVSYPSNHIPNPGGSSATCANCHTTGDFSVYVMSHAGITNNCGACHAYGLQATFAGNWTPHPLVAPPSGATGHIPSNAPNGTLNIACESCHLATNFTTFSGTVMKHAYVTSMQCMACHELGMKWKTNTGVRLWVRDSASHHAGQDCDGSGCHTSRDKRALRRSAADAGGNTGAIVRGSGSGAAGGLLQTVGGGLDHRRAAGMACTSCHNGTTAGGRPAGHIATSASCGSCHGTLAWLPVLGVDHAQVSGTCASCHDGTTARGKSRSHVASGNDCLACHTTNAWTPARFDHAGVAPHSCNSCHDGLHAMGLPLDHVPTRAQCDTCHGTLAWKPAKLDHSTLTAQCATCHDNRVALGEPVGHFGTQRDCALCHSYPDWTTLRFVHQAASYPGQHRAALACQACHAANSEAVAWASPTDKGSCGGCHAKDYIAARHPKVQGGVAYTASELRDCTGACHVYKDAGQGAIATPRPGPYHRVGDAAFRH